MDTKLLPEQMKGRGFLDGVDLDRWMVLSELDLKKTE
jgi:hypothetical protein